MPNLKRRLYAPKDVIDTYQAYNRNQDAYLTKMEASSNMLTKEVICDMVFEKFTRNIDRPKLSLKMNMTKEQDIRVSETSKMKHYVDMWWKANTIIGKVLRFVYKSKHGATEHELKHFIKQCGSENSDELFRHLTRDNKEYKQVFTRTNDNITELNRDAIIYIESKE